MRGLPTPQEAGSAAQSHPTAAQVAATSRESLTLLHLPASDLAVRNRNSSSLWHCYHKPAPKPIYTQVRAGMCTLPIPPELHRQTGPVMCCVEAPRISSGILTLECGFRSTVHCNLALITNALCSAWQPPTVSQSNCEHSL